MRCLLLALLVAVASGCAVIPPDSGKDPRDPWETYNRHVFEFNDRVDRAVLKPVAQAYVKITPEPVRDCISNVFSNAGEVPSALNNLLQGKPVTAVSDICRFVINSTVGLLGCFDVASKMGLERSNEDFGQTLGRWGIEPGPYFVLPVLGPSSVRDTTGRVGDYFIDPLRFVEPDVLSYGLTGLRIVDFRASLLEAEKVVEGAALDRYRFIRDAYLQRRRNLVYDGDPPREKEEDEEVEAASEKPKDDAAKDKTKAEQSNDEPGSKPVAPTVPTPTPPAPGPAPKQENPDQPSPVPAR